MKRSRTIKKTNSAYKTDGTLVTPIQPEGESDTIGNLGDAIDKVIGGGSTNIPEAMQVTVTYANNGHGTAPETQKVTLGKHITLPTMANDGYYSFTGWSDGTTTYAAGATVAAMKDTTFTAQWQDNTPSYTITAADSSTITVGTTTTLTLSPAVPEGATVTWSSNNPDVATVDSQGKVTGVAKGTADITATITGGGAAPVTAGITITVNANSGGGGGGIIVPSYSITVADSDNGAVAVSPKNAVAGKSVTITTTPDDGYKLDTLVVTDKNGDALTLTDNGDGTYSFTMPSGKVNVTATFVKEEEPSTDVSDIFIDVAPDAWYIDAVQFAYDEGIMTGTSATTFSPELTTSRGMIVSMLARLEGLESAESVGFTDVSADAWYANAVNWAARVGIVNGFEDNTFRPNDPITREQLAAILYNYAEYKGMDVSKRADLSKYSDAESISGWATDVLSWANAEGLVNGMTETTLAPQGEATRAQVAAIMQRFLTK